MVEARIASAEVTDDGEFIEIEFEGDVEARGRISRKVFGSTFLSDDAMEDLAVELVGTPVRNPEKFVNLEKR